MTAVILHLSDIHIKTNADEITKQGSAIAAATYPHLPSASHIFIICTGDVAYSGTRREYDAAKTLLTEIERSIRKENACPISFIVTPGNHDCNFEKDTGARKALITTLDKAEQSEIDDSIIDICTSIQSEFTEFRNALENNPTAIDDKLWRTSTFQVEGKRIDFECINVSWASKIKEEAGKIFFPLDRYTNRKFDTTDIRIVLLHHPLNWFSQSIYRPFRTFVRKLANIIISGHEHKGTVGTVVDAESDSSSYIEGCVLQSKSNDLSDSSFNVVEIDLGQEQFSSTRYKWNGDRYAAAEEGSWFDYHDLPAKSSNPFAITHSFQEVIEDPGAFFKHPSRKSIGLSDIFVYPDLRKVGKDEDRRRVYASASRLLAPDVTANGVLIEGEEKAGGTSLLYQLFRQYHERGFVPLYIRGRELKRVSDNDIEKTIRNAVNHQYGEDKAEDFAQLSRAQKLLLLDNFDDSQIQAGNGRAELLCSLKKRFAHLVIVVGDMFEMREMLDSDTSRALASLTHYKLQPFGHALRGELISKWLSLGTDGTINEGELIGRIDQAEKLVNLVMRKAVIPSAPIYLLTLLQSIDSGRSGDFKESALGDYYHYLLTEALSESGVKPDKLTEYFHYSAQLAWYFHQQEMRELSEAELRQFNDDFNKKWHTVDFKQRLDVLLKARVLCRTGDDYSFRYPYIYYYLKGRFLSENLLDLTVRAYIEHCCHHLYVRDHANTILFLAHHSNDDFVLKAIADALHNIFRDRSPVKFNGDTSAINTLIEDAPKLTYTGEKPADHRTRRNKLKDQLDDGHDGLLDREEDAKELSLIAQMTMLFKTTEILGQILKNQYSTIQRTRKRDLLEDLFNGPLRAIRDFYQFFEKNPDALVVEIESALQRKGKSQSADEQRNAARVIAASLIQLVTFSFIMRAAQSANSESLQEDVRDVVKRANTPAFKLIELGIILDSPRPIPRSSIKRLFEEIKDDLIASRLVQIMTLNRLYMFRTTEQDMQWIRQELGIDLAIQHAITYQESKGRISK